MSRKLAWLKFYPADWLGDELLQSCSSAARGLWIDMLCLMHKSDRRGFLRLNGSPLHIEQVARLTHRSVEESTVQIQELISAGVTSVSDSGEYFSRRMDRDEQKRTKCAAAGQKGGGNPTFGNSKGECKGGAKGPSKTLASKTLNSESLELIYHAYPRRVGRQAAMTAIRKALKDVILPRAGPNNTAEWLLGRVQSFSKSPKGQAGTWTLYPATWMNKGHYDDDDREWYTTAEQSTSPARIRSEPGKYAGIGIKLPAPDEA